MITINLGGEQGNAYYIMALVEDILKQLDMWNEIPAYREKATSGDYQNLLKVTGEYLDRFGLAHEFIHPRQDQDDAD